MFNQSILLYILLGITAVLFVLVIHLEVKIKRLKIGKNSESLEDSISTAKKNLENLNAFQKAAITHLEDVEKRLSRSVQAVETIRFNPFKGEGFGGNQSFSTAFLNENGDGVIISSMYSRDRVSVFSKPLEKFQSSFELTEEEKEVISNSQTSLK